MISLSKFIAMKKISLLVFTLSSLFVTAQNEKLPGLTANINGLTGGTITRQQILDAKEISVSDTNFVVKQYRFSAYAKDKDPVQIDFHSNAIPDKLKEAVAKLPPGTKIYFEYIKAEHAHVNGNRPQLPALAFTLK
jgi:GldM C-terminal domain